MHAPAPTTRWLIFLVMLALLGWGLLHALGAAQGAGAVGQNLVRGAIVLACFAAFLGLWGAALYFRAHKKK